MKTKFFYILIFFTILWGCSSTKEVQTNGDKNNSSKLLENEREAQDHFIRGTLHDLKGEFPSAILEYQDALALDEQAGIHFAMSKDYLLLHKIVPALEHSRKAVLMSPNDVEYNFLLGNIFQITQNVDSAEFYYKKVISLDSLYYQAYYSLAKINEPTKPLKALEIYNRLLDLTGPEWSVLLKIAELNERMGNVDKTVATVERLLKLDPSNIKLQKLLIESYLKTNQNEKAIALANDALTMFPNDLSLIEYKGNGLANLNRWEEAADEYKKILTSKELNFEVKKNIAGGFVAEASRDSSLIPIAKRLIKEIESDTTDWQLNAFLGELSVQEKNDSAAIDYFLKASELAPWNAQLWNRIGILLFDSQRYAEAVVEMKKAIEKFPDDFVDNLILGLALSQQKDIDGAERALEHAVRLNPNDITALNAYGFTLNQQKKTDAALIYLDKALLLDPNNIQVLGTMGMIYDSMGKYTISDSLYERALKIDSTDVLIANNFAYSLSERGVQLDRAFKLSEFAITQEPENSSYLDTFGWVYFKKGNYKEAINYIKKAIKYDEANATLFDHLADVYWKMNDKKMARQYWEKALELDPTMEKVKTKLEEIEKG